MDLSTGKLTVRAYAASEAIPISKVNIIVRGTDDVSRGIIYNLITDIDGITETITLPAPSISYTLSPSPKEMPYSLYDISAEKEGYQTKTIKNVAIFAEREAILPINMIPTENMDNPKGNSDSLITQNDNLM